MTRTNATKGTILLASLPATVLFSLTARAQAPSVEDPNLSVRTVEAHVDHILSKLGFRTGTQLAAWIHEEGLAPRIT